MFTAILVVFMAVVMVMMLLVVVLYSWYIDEAL